MIQLQKARPPIATKAIKAIKAINASNIFAENILFFEFKTMCFFVFTLQQMVLTVIHIGKCGGSSLSHLLRDNHKSHRSIHIDKPEFKRADKYVILIRNPISRFISAFNWRYKLVVTDKSQENRFPGEKAILMRYGSVNNFAESIETVNKQYIHHIHENIDYYLGDFLKDCKKESIIGVITQENFDADVKTVFDISNTMIHAKK